MTTFVEVMATLTQLCEEHQITPPKLTLNFDRQVQRMHFEEVLRQEFKPLNINMTYPHNAMDATVHGIKVRLI